MTLREGLLLFALSLGALLVHGYHPYAEDAEIYLPGVEKILNPQLFPVGAEYFGSHASLSLYPNLIAASVHLTHLSLGLTMFFWHLMSIFLFLLACWELSRRLFPGVGAHWGGVIMAAALLTLPVAGTALYVMDQYVNPRNFCAFAAVFTVVRLLERKYARAIGWLTFAAVMHPLMAVYVIAFCCLWLTVDRWPSLWRMTMILPFGFSLELPSLAYRRAAEYHAFHYIQHWAWYEWLGIVGPVGVLWWFARIAERHDFEDLRRLCRVLIGYDLLFFSGALVLALSDRFGTIARLQPLRSLHLLYVLLIVISGSLLGGQARKNRPWRLLVLATPLVLGMFFAQRSLFPASSHVEWPWARPRNLWAQAFVWVRDNTRSDAVFALDPFYAKLPGEDTNGFRALAERSMLADVSKDSGAVTMFPPLADTWLEQVQAREGWKDFRKADFVRLYGTFGVGWVIVEQPRIDLQNCPYQNPAVRVCRIP